MLAAQRLQDDYARGALSFETVKNDHGDLERTAISVFVLEPFLVYLASAKNSPLIRGVLRFMMDDHLPLFYHDISYSCSYTGIL